MKKTAKHLYILIYIVGTGILVVPIGGKNMFPPGLEHCNAPEWAIAKVAEKNPNYDNGR